MSKPMVAHYAIHDEICEDLARDFARFYRVCVEKGVTDMTIEINTNGGDIAAMNSIISYIERPGITIHGFVAGYAYSAGIFILRACDVAYASDSANLMFHDICMSTEWSMDSVKQEHKNIRRISNAIIKRFAKKTTHTAKWWKKHSYFNPLNEILMSPKEALRFGIIDYVGTPVLTVSTKRRLKVKVI